CITATKLIVTFGGQRGDVCGNSVFYDSCRTGRRRVLVVSRHYFSPRQSAPTATHLYRRLAGSICAGRSPCMLSASGDLTGYDGCGEINAAFEGGSGGGGAFEIRAEAEEHRTEGDILGSERLLLDSIVHHWFPRDHLFPAQQAEPGPDLAD